jgi:hypothetical protein
VFIHSWGAALMLLTLEVWVLEGVVRALCSGLDPDRFCAECLLAVVLASFVSVIPAAPGLVGTYDSDMVFALKACNVAAARTSACS